MKRAGSKRAKSGVVKIGRASGRVKCYIRIRPLNVDELDRDDETAVEVSDDKKEVLVNDTHVGLDKNYQFDHVFPPDTTNPQISNFITKPLVNAALNGFNGTVMAYGQTGSGKTYTLMSPDGVAATIIEKSFRKMAANKNLQYKVSMSYLQIYQEKIYDLLNNAASSKIDLTIREHPQKGIYVENLSEYVVRGPEEVHSLMQLGKKRLVFAETKMNRTSSRSHSVCILSIERSSKHSDKSKAASPSAKKQIDKKLHATLLSEGVETPEKMAMSFSQDGPSSESEEEDDALSKMMAFNEDVVLKGHLYICDLAGSERIKKTKAEGERLSEAQHINFSLLELGNVIQALAESADSGRTGHIPFRNSTLTRLLQESLGGNCKTSLVVCCSPSELHVHETKCSLNFGSRAMKVTNTAYVNVEMDYKKLSDDLAKLLDARDKEIEELKLSQQRELDSSKKEAEMAAEMKFGDGLTEARKAYVALKHLLDSQASAHAVSMSKLQAELSREQDARLALEEELQNKRNSSSDRQSSTKCLLLAEVLSMQLFYTLECTASISSEMIERASQELVKQDVFDTQEEILENVDNLIGVLGTYLNLTEREFCEARSEECYSDEDIESNDGRVDVLQTLVLKIRKRLKVLKDSVDERTLRFLNNVIDRKDRTQMENMTDVYQALQNLLTIRRNSTDPEFLDNSQDAERCLTYVLLDKALLCCLVVLERNASDRKCLELGKKHETTTQELEIIRHRNKSLKNDNERLIAQLERRRNETLVHDVKTSGTPGENHKPVEALMIRNSNLQLEIDTLRKQLGSRRNDCAGTKKDLELGCLRERVSKLTKENEKLEFMMKVMGERFSQDELAKVITTREAQTQVPLIEEETAISTNNNIPTERVDRKTGKLISTYDSETIMTSANSRSPNLRQPEVEKMLTFTSDSPYDDEEEETVSSLEREEFREHLVKSKAGADKTLKHLFEIKVDETLQFLDTDKSKKLTQLVDSAIDSADHVNMSTGLILNSSMEDIEALERDINAMKVNNEALGRQCLLLVKDRSTLESLLTELRGNIAGLQEKVAQKNSPTALNIPAITTTQTETSQVDSEITTEAHRTKTSTSPSVQVRLWESDNVKKVNLSSITREFTTKTCQTDVSFVSDSSNESGESDGLEDESRDDLKSNLVIKKITRKYSLMKQLLKHLEGEIRNFKIKTTALETELKERQHLKDQNILLEEEVKELQGLKIYLESQLAEGGESAGKPDSFDAVKITEKSNLKKWKDYGEDSLSDLSASTHLSSSTLNLTLTPNSYGHTYESMSRSMMDLSESQLYTSVSSLRSSRGNFGSLKMLKLEMEGRPSRIRDKLKSASLLLQHTGSLESQLKASRQKCFRLEGEVCKLVKEKKEISEELDKVRARLRAEECITHDVETVEKLADDTTPLGSKTKRRSFKFHRGKEEKDRLKNELSLAKEQLTKLKSQLEMANTSVQPSNDRRAGYSELSEEEKRREKELALTRERCLILAEELGASNKEKIKLGDDLQESLDNIDMLAVEVTTLEKERLRLEKRVAELEKNPRENKAEDARTFVDDEKLAGLRSDVASLLNEKINLEESISELKWEKERLNEMENIVKRLVQVEKEKKQLEGDFDVSQERAELMRLRKDNEDLREQLASLNEVLMEQDSGSKSTSLTQVLSAVKDGKRRKSEKQATRERGLSEPRSSHGTKSGSSDREDGLGHKERSGSEKKSRSKVLASLLKH